MSAAFASQSDDSEAGSAGSPFWASEARLGFQARDSQRAGVPSTGQKKYNIWRFQRCMCLACPRPKLNSTRALYGTGRWREADVAACVTSETSHPSPGSWKTCRGWQPGGNGREPMDGSQWTGANGWELECAEWRARRQTVHRGVSRVRQCLPARQGRAWQPRRQAGQPCPLGLAARMSTRRDCTRGSKGRRTRLGACQSRRSS